MSAAIRLAAIRLEVAREKIAEMTAEELARYVDHDELWRLSWRVGVAIHKLDLLFKGERLKRGIISSTDLTPQERRELVSKDSLDLHAIAAGPIMDAGEIYCPLGKISMAEARKREARQMLP